MSSASIAHATTDKVDLYLDRQWQEGKNKCLITPARLGLVPASVVMHAADAVVGIFAGLANIFSAGSIDSVNERTLDHLSSADQLLTSPCIALIKMINPSFKPGIVNKPGILLPPLFDFFGEHAQNCFHSKNLLKRHLLGRVSALLLAIASIVAKVVDTVMGILAFTLSLLALGRWKQINNFAIKSLTSVGITMFFIGLTLFVRGKN